MRLASRSAAAVSRAIHFLRSMAAQQRQRCRSRRTQCGHFHWLARGQPLQNPTLHVLPFARQFALPPSSQITPYTTDARCPILFVFFAKWVGSPDLGISLHRRSQQIPSQVGDSVVNGTTHLGRKRQHAAQHFAKRSQVVLRRPRAQFQQVVAQQRLLVEYGLEVPHFEISRRLGSQSRHHADQLLAAKRHNHARPTLRRLPLAHAVSKRVVQRHRQRDFAVGRHGRQDSV